MQRVAGAGQHALVREPRLEAPLALALPLQLLRRAELEGPGVLHRGDEQVHHVRAVALEGAVPAWRAALDTPRSLPVNRLRSCFLRERRFSSQLV